MKKHYSLLTGLLLLLGVLPGMAQTVSQRTCHSYEHELQLRDQYPLEYEETIEQFEQWLEPEVQRVLDRPATQRAVLTIPIVFHVIHNGEAVGTGDNLSAALINAQLDQLNNDFRRLAGTSGANNNPVGADTEIEFCAAQFDPNGNPLAEAGINRINRNAQGWSAPPYGSCQGGNFGDAYIENTIKPQSGWDPADYLNFWIMDVSCGILGYAQFPSSSGLGGLNNNGGAASTDGVVCIPSSIGSTTNPNPAGGTYNKGRTATHEVGHYLGLRHIWGDGGCSVDDFCNDTPASDGPNYGCPNTSSCGSTDMVENYMDYTDDDCMNVFTANQKARIQAVMANSPRRASLPNSTACSGGGGGGGNACAATVSSFPYGESFEGGTGAWSQSNTDDIDWTRRSGGTPSGSTGPSGASAGNFYLYVESSNPNFPGKTAILNGPCFDFGGAASPELTFAYHMLGNAVGTLNVQASTDGSSWNTVFTRSGSQGSAWQSATVDLSAYGGNAEVRLRFVGTTANSWQGDICIDALGVSTSAPVPAPVASFTGAPTTITEGASVSFNNQSTNATAYSWSFAGGSPASSTAANPTVSYNTPGTYSVTLTATGAGGTDSQTRTNYITVNAAPPTGGGGCTNGIASFPYSEGWEGGSGAWSNISGDDFNWTRRSGGTPSNGTGPGSAVQGSFYYYVESSSPNYSNKTAIFSGPCFDLTGKSAANFAFRYHMYGANAMGSLSLQARASGSWTTIWTRSSNQGNSWRSADVDLGNYLGGGVELRFVGTTGTTWKGDMAIDALGLTASGGGGGNACVTVDLTIDTDQYPGETTWAITDGSGATVASGGPYNNANSTFTESACLPNGCYTFTIFDSYGDGICCAYGNGSYQLVGGGAILAAGGTFGGSDATNFCVSGAARTGGPAITIGNRQTDAQRARLSTYPNPVQAQLTVEHVAKADHETQLRVVDTYGRTVLVQVWSLQAGPNRLELLTDRLPNGTYLLYLDDAAIGQRFVVLK